MKKRLYKSQENRVLLGVCGGIGEYLDIDPTIVRLVWIVLCVIAGSGILAYLIAGVIIPAPPMED